MFVLSKIFNRLFQSKNLNIIYFLHICNIQQNTQENIIHYSKKKKQTKQKKTKQKKKKHCGGGLENKPEVCQVLDSIISINTLSIKKNNLILVRNN